MDAEGTGSEETGGARVAPMLDHMERYLRLALPAALSKGTRVIVVRQPWMDKAFTPEEEAVMWNFPWGRLCFEQEESAHYTHAVVKRPHVESGSAYRAGDQSIGSRTGEPPAGAEGGPDQRAAWPNITAAAVLKTPRVEEPAEARPSHAAV